MEHSQEDHMEHSQENHDLGGRIQKKDHPE